MLPIVQIELDEWEAHTLRQLRCSSRAVVVQEDDDRLCAGHVMVDGHDVDAVRT